MSTMRKTANAALTPNAQRLRREMTPEERHLWYDFLRSLPAAFRRQKVIGNYIADFYCAQAKVVIELDGSQHYEDAAKEADAARDAYFTSLGLKVLRYSNAEVKRNFTGVCEEILAWVSREWER